MSLITLTSDFGLKDPFVGMMKGVIYNINNAVTLIDISHGIDNQDIFSCAFIIYNSFKYFPSQTIHVVVVDPGVGTGRRPILVKAFNHYFIGPDNGILSLLVAGDNGSVIYEITEERYFLRSPGNTFHGRDIFAPVAGWLSKCYEPDKFGHIISDHVSIDFRRPHYENGVLQGEIIYVDRFGNLFTNISCSDLKNVGHGVYDSSITIKFNEHEISIRKYYAEAVFGKLAAVINSFGLIELFSFMGNAAEEFNAGKGDVVRLFFK
ncbi:MAG: SAM-dependent chlorinase/fluorinase [Nitrospirae bacterium]|nr:SAM-dependent chlorinase/fluorinase [Nitrospirota bacterium]